jgi:hypothetical protein
MSLDIRLTPDGDLYEQNTFVRGVEETIQSVVIRVYRHRGEWFLDPDVGIPYIEWFGFKQGITNDTIEDLLRLEIEGVRNVADVQALSVTKEDRIYKVDATILVYDEATDETVQVELTTAQGAARWRVL